MCNQRMKESLVYPHLDTCTGQDTTVTLAPPKRRVESYTRLPSLNYTLTPVATLRKKLAELHIRTSGPKTLLEKRHTEWVAVWNANCDAPEGRQRTRRELLAEMDAWERSNGETAGGGGGGGGVMAKTAGGAGVMRKDFDGPAWAKRHGDDFGRLVAAARAVRGGKTKAEAASTDEAPGAQGDQAASGGKATPPLPPETTVVALDGEAMAEVEEIDATPPDADTVRQQRQTAELPGPASPPLQPVPPQTQAPPQSQRFLAPPGSAEKRRRQAAATAGQEILDSDDAIDDDIEDRDGDDDGGGAETLHPGDGGGIGVGVSGGSAGGGDI